MSEAKLPRIFNRAATEMLHAELVEAIGAEPTDGPYPLDASGVEQLSHCGLQLLVSAAKTGPGIAINNASEAFVKAVQMAGLETVLEEVEKA